MRVYPPFFFWSRKVKKREKKERILSYERVDGIGREQHEELDECVDLVRRIWTNKCISIQSKRALPFAYIKSHYGFCLAFCLFVY